MSNCALLLFLVLLGTSGTIAGEIIATTKNGKLRGVAGRNYDGEEFYQFFGVPYAQPPLGQLRFKPPAPGGPWPGVRDASSIGDACISRDDFSSKTVGSEDCLYLNVYTKSLSPNSPLRPVMVFIHGGGFTVGSSRPGIYGPEFLMLKDIVLVTFNYRLGVLGFLSFDDPKLDVPGNLGLKDQVQALKWVKENIGGFRGDPDNVTIFGNSAGSSSVHAHILSKASKGLFHKAIMESGTVLNPWFWGSKNNAKEVAAKAGRPSGSDQEALEVLRGLEASEIFNAQQKIYDSPYPAERRPFSAVIEAVPEDGGLLTKSPVKAIEKGSYNKVPIMMGYTETEGMLLDFDRLTTKEVGQEYPDLELQKVIPHNLNVSWGSNQSLEIRDRLAQLYSEPNISKDYDPMTDGFFLVGILEAVRLHLKTLDNPIYLYRMSLSSELNLLKALLNKTHEPGVGHADELGYLFHSEKTPQVTPGSLEDRSLRTFVELWTNFAIHGNPTPDGTWKPVKKGPKVGVLDIGESLQMKEDIPERRRMDVWGEILKKHPIATFA